MPPKKNVVRHLRVGPDVDVGLCGARGTQANFALSRKWCNCDVCKEKANDPVREAEHRKRLSDTAHAIKAAQRARSYGRVFS